MNALGIPTTRSLAMVLYPSLPVQRESSTPEKAAVVTRVAPSFIRIGNFESLNPPTNAFAFGFTGQQVPSIYVFTCGFRLTSSISSRVHTGKGFGFWENGCPEGSYSSILDPVKTINHLHGVKRLLWNVQFEMLAWLHFGKSMASWYAMHEL